MSDEQNRVHIAAVIPALNEEKTIGVVVEALKASPSIGQIIVVDDGSTDTTAQRAEQSGARVIRQSNQGKGKAMQSGARHTEADLILFADADLIGLTPQHVEDLIRPIVNGEVGMTIGLRDRGPVVTRLLPFIAPVLGGERVISRELFLTFGGVAASDFGIETVMNAVCKKRNIPIRVVPLWGVTQVIKERKYGFWKGFNARLRMIMQVLRAQIEVLFSKDV